MGQPQNSTTHQFTSAEYSAYVYPTSPWTDAYQDAPMMDAEDSQAAASQHAADAASANVSDTASFDDEVYQPTHDALSDIYNREV